MTHWIGGAPDSMIYARTRGPAARELSEAERRTVRNVRRSRGGCAAHTVARLACVVREDLSPADDFDALLDTIIADFVSRGWLTEHGGRFEGRPNQSWFVAFVDALEYWTGAKWERVPGRYAAKHCPSVAKLQRELRPSDAVACYTAGHVGALYGTAGRHLLGSRHKVKDLFVQRSELERLAPRYRALL